MIILHIAIALASIIFTSIAYFNSSRASLRTAYGFIAGTLLSGTYLVATAPSHLVSACLTGLVYLGIVSIGIVAAHRKLALNSQKTS
jgi:hypothetical protein